MDDVERPSMKTLKLDSSYRPVAIVDAIEALILCLIGKAKPVEHYEQFVRTPNNNFKLPAVIALIRYVKYKHTGINCNRQNVCWRDKHICQYCTKRFKAFDLTMDHVVPRSRGGETVWENIVTACKKCNQKKADKTPQEAGMKLLRYPYKPKNSVLRTLGVAKPSEIWKNYLWESI